MTEHLTDDDIRLYHERRLTGRARLDISEHMLGCGLCRSRVFQTREVPARIDLAPLLDEDDEHLSYDDMAGYVDGERPDGKERMDEHLRECKECSAELEHLRELSHELHAHRPQRSPSARASQMTRGWAAALAVAAAVTLIIGIGYPLRPNRFSSATNAGNEATSVQAPAAAATQPTAMAEEIQDGWRLVTLAPGAITGLDGLEEVYRVAVERALSSRRVEVPPVLRALSGKSGVLLGPGSGDPADTEMLAPVGVVVSSNRPLFRWRGPRYATYRVSVFDESYAEVAASEGISAQTWQPRAPLRPGRTYSWQLSVRQNDVEKTVPVPPAPESRFRTIDAATAAEIDRVRQKWNGSHLVLALAYANFGLLDDAQEQFEVLRKQNPRSETVAALSASLERLRTGSSGSQ